MQSPPPCVVRVYAHFFQVKPRTAEDMASGLPRDLHLALLAGMMLAELLGKGLPAEQGCATHVQLVCCPTNCISCMVCAVGCTVQMLGCLAKVMCFVGPDACVWLLFKQCVE
jgi:hypothetical protein